MIEYWTYSVSTQQLLRFSVVCLMCIWWNRYSSILMKTAVFPGHIAACVSLTPYIRKRDVKRIFMLRVYFLLVCPQWFVCWALSAARTRLTYMKYCAWSWSWSCVLQDWSCCCYSANTPLTLHRLCRPWGGLDAAFTGRKHWKSLRVLLHSSMFLVL